MDIVHNVTKGIMNKLTNNVFLNKDITIKMRGLAMLLILAGHIVSSFGEKPFFFFVNNRIVTPLGGIGCAIFLFISGYGLYESYKKNGLKQYWSKRLLTLFVPYLLFVGLFYIARPICPLLTDSVYEVLNSSQWYWNYYWFLKYIAIWYVLFFFINRYAHRYNIFLILLSATIMFFFINSENMAEQSYSFALGFIVSRNKDIIINNWDMKKIGMIAIFCLIVGIFALMLKQMPYIRNIGQDSIAYRLCELFIKLPVGVFLMTLLHSLNIKSLRILTFVGFVAYELYLVQMPYLQTIQSSYMRMLVFLMWISLLTLILYKLNGIIMNKIYCLLEVRALK